MNSHLALVVVGYFAMSAVAFGAYRIDKSRALRGDRRIPEITLHAIELLGGWPGAWVAQRAFRHKWRKTSYMLVFWGIAAIHAVAWAWWSAAVW